VGCHNNPFTCIGFAGCPILAAFFAARVGEHEFLNRPLIKPSYSTLAVKL
jgi:hypothetical protein